MPTHVDPRADALSSLVLACEKLFSAFKRRRVHAEKCWNVGITRACVCVGVRTHSTASYVFIAANEYTRDAYAICLFFPSLSLSPSPSPFVRFPRARARAPPRIVHMFTPTRCNVYRLINAKLFPYPRIYATSIFGTRTAKFSTQSMEIWKLSEQHFRRCLRSESYATRFASAMKFDSHRQVSSVCHCDSFAQHYGVISHCDKITPYLVTI